MQPSVASRLLGRSRLLATTRRYPLLLKNLRRFTVLNLFLGAVAAISWLSSKGGIFAPGLNWSEAISLVALSWIALPAFIGRFPWSEQRARQLMLISYCVGIGLLLLSVAGREANSFLEELTRESRDGGSALDGLRSLEETTTQFVAPATFYLSVLSLYWFFIHAHRAVLFKVGIRLRWHHQAQFAGIYMAQADGIFEKNGLDVTIEERDPQRNLANLVGSGTAEFGLLMAPEVVRLHSENRELMPVEIISLYSPLELMINQQATFDQIRSNKPVKILSVEHYIEDSIIGSFLMQSFRGQDQPPRIDISYYSDNDGAESFLSGEYHGIVVHRANEKIYLQRKMSTESPVTPLILNAEQNGLTLLGETLVTSLVFAGEHPEVVNAMRRAVIKGWESAVDKFDRAAVISLHYRRRSSFASDLGRGWKQELGHQRAMLREMIHMFHKRREFRGHQTEGIWAEVIRSCMEAGIIDKDSPVTPEQMLGLPRFTP